MSGIEQRPQPKGHQEPVISLDQAMAESGAVVIEQGEQFPEVDFSGLLEIPEDLKASLENLGDRCSAFLALPLFADAFTNEVDRSDWRMKLIKAAEPDTVRFFTDNRLRKNYVSWIVNVLPSTQKRFSVVVPQSNRAIAISEALHRMSAVIDNPITFGDRYNMMSIDERIALVQELSDAARSYLRAGRPDISEASVA